MLYSSVILYAYIVTGDKLLINRDYPSDYSSSDSGSSDDDTDSEADEEGGGGGRRKRKRQRETFFDDFIEAEFRKRRKVCTYTTICSAFCYWYTFSLFTSVVDYSCTNRAQSQQRYQVSKISNT